MLKSNVTDKKSYCVYPKAPKQYLVGFFGREGVTWSSLKSEAKAFDYLSAVAQALLLSRDFHVQKKPVLISASE